MHYIFCEALRTSAPSAVKFCSNRRGRKGYAERNIASQPFHVVQNYTNLIRGNSCNPWQSFRTDLNWRNPIDTNASTNNKIKICCTEFLKEQEI